MKSRPKTGTILGVVLAGLGILCSIGYIYFYITQSALPSSHNWLGDVFAGIWGVIVGVAPFWQADKDSTRAKFLKALFVGGIVMLIVMDRLIGPMGGNVFIIHVSAG